MSDRIPPITNEELNRILGIEQIQDLELTDPSYTQNLNAYLHVLQDNIERVLSVPFLQGQRGESILAAQFRLFEDDGSLEGERAREYGWRRFGVVEPI